jgi:hypothetical protein
MASTTQYTTTETATRQVPFLFPRWSNNVLPFVFFFVLGPLGTALVGGIWYYGTNKHTEVGYTPVQPVAYSHKLHAGDLGMDCRYCHYSVEKSSFAAVPPTQVCMNCHAKVRTDSAKLLPVRESYASGLPLAWVKVHNLPDYVYFNHSAHLAGGVACVSCHGRVDQMIQVSQVQPLSMSWCLECHRNPGPSLRDPSQVTVMDPALSAVASSTVLAASSGGPAGAVSHTQAVNPPLHCSGCHR